MADGQGGTAQGDSTPQHPSNASSSSPVSSTTPSLRTRNQNHARSGSAFRPAPPPPIPAPPQPPKQQPQQVPPPLPIRPHAESGGVPTDQMESAMTASLMKRLHQRRAMQSGQPGSQQVEQPSSSSPPSTDTNEDPPPPTELASTFDIVAGLSRSLSTRRKPLPVPLPVPAPVATPTTAPRTTAPDSTGNSSPLQEDSTSPTSATNATKMLAKMPFKPLPSIPVPSASSPSSPSSKTPSPRDHVDESSDDETTTPRGSTVPSTSSDATAADAVLMEDLKRRLTATSTTEEHPGYAINDSQNKAYEETYRLVDRLEPRIRRESIMIRRSPAGSVGRKLVKPSGPLPEIPHVPRRRRSSQSRPTRKPLPLPTPAARRKESLHRHVSSDASDTSSPREDSPGRDTPSSGRSLDGGSTSTDPLVSNSGSTTVTNGTDEADDESSETTSETVSESVADSRAESITAFHQACFSGELDLIRQMLQRCSDGDGNRAQDGVVDSDDETEDDLSGMSRYELVNSRDPIDNSTGLHKAAARGKCTVMEILIENGALIDAIDSVEGAPIHYAASNNRADSISVLIKYAPVKAALISMRDGYGYFPIHLSIKAGHFDAAEVLLIFGADINSRTRGGKTPLSIVVENSDLRGLRFLISKGVQINSKDDQGMTALLRVIGSSQHEMLECILESFSGQNAKTLNLAFVNKDSGWNALHYAVIQPNLSILSLLLERIFDASNHGDSQKSLSASLLKQRDSVNLSTPIHLAVAVNEKPNVVRTIIEAVVVAYQEMLPELLSIQDTFGNTPLHTAIMQNKWMCCEVFVLSLREGAAMNNILKIKNVNKQTPASLFKAAGRDWKKLL